MKRLIATVVVLATVCISVVTAQNIQDFCGTQDYHEWLLQHNPQYKTEFLQRENLIQAKIIELSTSRRLQVVYSIPVVVHVIHIGEPVGSGSNISDQQIYGAIDGLNDRFRNIIGNGVDAEIEFCLAERDPNGNPTSGINRVNGSGVPDYSSYGVNVCGCTIGANDVLIKDLSTWPVDDYYNIWVAKSLCNGQWAGCAGSNGATMLYSSMQYSSSTLAHELGHGFGLPHTFDGDDNGSICPIDTNCTVNGDFSCDTPPHNRNDCGATNPCTSNQTLWDNSRYNYMSYCGSRDRFTQDQKVRMIAAVNSYQSRLIDSLKCSPSTCAAVCNDGNPCTIDICDNGNCVYQSILCNDGHPCTTDQCIGGNCFYTEINCDDNNSSTFDYCRNGACQHMPYISGLSCETFDGASNCGNNTFSCVTSASCDNALTSAGWQNAGEDDIDWSITNIATPTNNTGPDSDHTSGFGKYLYTEAWNCYNKTAILISPAYDLSSIPNPKLQFWYHMYGSYMGTLTVDIMPLNSSTWINLWNLSGNQGTEWLSSDIGLSVYANDTVRFRFRGKTGGFIYSNLAIDDICVSSGCSLSAECNDNIACTIDTCSNFICVNTIIDCNDGDPCTLDSCVNGICNNVLIANCIPCVEPDLFIADNATVSDSVNINAFGIISDLNIKIDISHTWIEDLNVVLKSPSGSSVTLFSNSCGSSDNILAIFDDEGTAPSCPPSGFTTIIPSQSLSAFDGEQVNGTWILSISDNFDQDPGILNEWCLQPAFSDVEIAGFIQTESATLIQGATVILSEDESDTIVTASDGFYSFNVASNSLCKVTPSKSNDYVATNGVSTLDITLIRRHLLTRPVLLSTPYRIIAADVNRDDSVTGGDILLLRQFILGGIPSFNGKLWTFVPDDFIFADLNNPFPYDEFRNYTNLTNSVSDQNFIGIKLGDVNNSWNSSILKTDIVGEVNFEMDDFQSLSGDELIVPVRVKNFNSLTGYQFTLTWNPEVLQLLEVVNQSIPAYYGEQSINEGILTTSWNDASGASVTLDDDSVAFELKFKVVGANGTASEIKIGSEITNSEAYTSNLDLLNIIPSNGLVKVGDVTTVSTPLSGCCELQVVPNPFSNTTNIIFSIPQDELVSITIYDLLGKQVKQIRAQFNKGEHRIEWTGDDENGNHLGNGLYHVRMEAGGDFIVAKAIMIR